MLEYIPNVIETLSLLHKSLIPNGLFIAVLLIDDFRGPLNKRRNLDNMDRHLHTWNPLFLGNTFTEAGYHPVKIDIVSHAWSHRFFFLGESFLQTLECRILSIVLKLNNY